MSNRVYLYSTNFIPGEDVDDRRVVGISEWGNDIPLGFKILVSLNPRKCPSLLFGDSQCGAIVADYDAGVARFLEFLARIPHHTMPALADEAYNFLSAANTKNLYFLLEPQEYFWLGDDEPATQMEQLLSELTDLDEPMEHAIADLIACMHEETHPPGFFTRLFRVPVRRETSIEMALTLALSGWSNNLFYAPT